MRLVFLALAAALAAAAAATAADLVSATMSTSSTMPVAGLPGCRVAGLPWRYTITVRTQTGDPVRARVRLQALRRSRLLGCWTQSGFVRCSENAGTWISISRRLTRAIVWPARWVGLELTFRAVVVTGTHTLRLRAPVAGRATG
jgi:hypothetical protein